MSKIFYVIFFFIFFFIFLTVQLSSESEGNLQKLTTFSLIYYYLYTVYTVQINLHTVHRTFQIYTQFKFSSISLHRIIFYQPFKIQTIHLKALLEYLCYLCYTFAKSRKLLSLKAKSASFKNRSKPT